MDIVVAETAGSQWTIKADSLFSKNQAKKVVKSRGYLVTSEGTKALEDLRYALESAGFNVHTQKNYHEDVISYLSVADEDGNEIDFINDNEKWELGRE